MANYFKHKAVHLLQGAGHSTPGNWGRPLCHVEEQREQRTSSNMVSAKTMANGYQPSIEVKRGGKASTSTPALTLGLTPSHPFSCPQQTQTTHRTHPTL
jgi:hypothetical protein